MASIDTLKQRIRDGETIVSLRVLIDIEQKKLEEALTKSRYDLIYIDGQHLAFSEAQLVKFCGFAEDLGIPVQMRLPHTRNAYLAGRYLDLGLGAILVPEVIHEATVDEAIAACYYPQVGTRSWGGAARHGLKSRKQPVDRLDYAEWWNSHGVLGIQLESTDAISNARKLAKPGIDYVAFGPNDLLFSLEGHPQFPLRTVDECMMNVAEQLRGTGISLGMAIPTVPEERDKFLKIGITVFQELPR